MPAWRNLPETVLGIAWGRFAAILVAIAVVAALVWVLVVVPREQARGVVFAHLDGALLSRAHLEGAELFKAHLGKADRSDAHLDGANLTRATQSG